MIVGFRPVEPCVFRWGGEFTWMVTGPSAEGICEPLPLPTTVVGAVVTSLKGTYSGSNRLDMESVEGVVKELLGSEVLVRGPFILGEEGYGFHLWPGRVAVIRPNKLLIHGLEQCKILIRGSALRHDTKVTVQHMAYSLQYIDYVAVKKLLGLSDTIAFELIRADEEAIRALGSINGKVARLGGEGRLARVSVGSESPLTSLLSKLTELVEGCLGEGKPCLAYVATPLILEPTQAKMLARGEIAEVITMSGLKVMIRAPRKAELREYLNITRDEEESRNKVKLLRVKLSIISPGYDTVIHSPRPTYPAIMPGSIIALASRDRDILEKVCMEGLGKWARLGWGTLIPIPPATAGFKVSLA